MWLGCAACALVASVGLLMPAPERSRDAFPLRTLRPLHPVRGRALCGGRPAAGATVYLHPRDGPDPARWPNGFPRAKVGSDGTFAVATDRPRDGAPQGRFAVLVRWPRGAALADRDEDRRADRFGGRFLNPERPHRVIDVGPNGLTDLRIDLPD